MEVPSVRSSSVATTNVEAVSVTPAKVEGDASSAETSVPWVVHLESWTPRPRVVRVESWAPRGARPKSAK
jgi:hypothetical protein